MLNGEHSIPGRYEMAQRSKDRDEIVLTRRDTLRRMTVPPPSNGEDQRIQAYFGQFKGWQPVLNVRLREMAIKRAAYWLDVRRVNFIPVDRTTAAIDIVDHAEMADTFGILRVRLGLKSEHSDRFFTRLVTSPAAVSWDETRRTYGDWCRTCLPSPFLGMAYKAFVETVYFEATLYICGREDDAAKVGAFGQVFRRGNVPVAYDRRRCVLHVLCAPSQQLSRPR
jgi:hypothetical protein